MGESLLGVEGVFPGDLEEKSWNLLLAILLMTGLGWLRKTSDPFRWRIVTSK